MACDKFNTQSPFLSHHFPFFTPKLLSRLSWPGGSHLHKFPGKISIQDSRPAAYLKVAQRAAAPSAQHSGQWQCARLTLGRTAKWRSTEMWELGCPSSCVLTLLIPCFDLIVSGFLLTCCFQLFAHTSEAYAAAAWTATAFASPFDGFWGLITFPWNRAKSLEPWAISIKKPESCCHRLAALLSN